MLLPFALLAWNDETNAWAETVVAVNPDAIAHVEPAGDLLGKATIHLWCDRMERPYRIVGTVPELVSVVNEVYGLVQEEEEAGS